MSRRRSGRGRGRGRRGAARRRGALGRARVVVAPAGGGRRRRRCLVGTGVKRGASRRHAAARAGAALLRAALTRVAPRRAHGRPANGTRSGRSTSTRARPRAPRLLEASPCRVSLCGDAARDAQGVAAARFACRAVQRVAVQRCGSLRLPLRWSVALGCGWGAGGRRRDGDADFPLGAGTRMSRRLWVI